MTNRRPNDIAIVGSLLTVGSAIMGYELYARLTTGGHDHASTGLISRILGGSIVTGAALLAIWLVLRHSPSLFSGSFSEKQLLEGARVSREERLRHYAEWFILMRWIAIVVAAALSCVAVRISGLLDGETYWPLVFTIAALTATNVLFAYLHRHGQFHRYLLQFQVGGDLLILTALLHFSGGIENPASLIMLLHVIIGGILLSRAECYAVAALGSLLFGVMAYLELTEQIQHYTLLVFPHEHGAEGLEHAAHEPPYVVARIALHAAILFLTALFVTTLAERQRRDERQLIRLADRAIAEGQLLDRSLDTTGAALRVIDEQMNTRFANRRWNDWFNASSTNPAMDAVLNGPQSPARLTLEDGRPRSTTLSERDDPEDRDGGPSTVRTTPGRVFRLTTAVLPVAEERGRQVVQLAQDVTEIKKAEARLIRAGQLAAVGELAGQVAHEVNNPIAVINAKARLLLSDSGDELSRDTAEELEKIIEMSDRVAGIAQGLLSYCRPSAASRTAIDATVPLQRALSMIEQRAASAGIRISRRFDRSLPRVHANAQEMEQVFLNLLLNALDAMPQGGELMVSAAKIEEAIETIPGPAVEITVRDSGAGIPFDVCERVFEPFFTTKEPGRGTGLGLSICQGLVRSHQGEITVRSEVGRGTEVTIWLPVAPGGHRPGGGP